MTEEQTTAGSGSKGIKKKVRTIILVVMLLIALPVIAWLTLKSNRFQTAAVRWLMEEVGKTFNTRIEVGGISISFLDKVTLEKIVVFDHSKDTLLCLDELRFNIDSLRPGTKRIHLNSVFVENPKIRLFQGRTGTNFQFILDTLASVKTPAADSKPWAVSFNNLFVHNGEIYFRKPLADTVPHDGINFNDLAIRKLNFSLVHVNKEKSGLSLHLDNASLEEKSGFRIRNLTFNALVDSAGIRMDKFALITPNSNIFSDSLIIRERKSTLTDRNNAATDPKLLPLAYRYEYLVDLAETRFSMADLAYYLPDLWGMEEKILVAGHMRGTIDNLKFRNLNLRVGQHTSFNADLELKGLPDWKNTFIFLKFSNNIFNFNDLASVKLPNNSPLRNIRIPSSLRDNINLEYQGTLSGFPDDFVAYGRLQGELGTLSTDIAISPSGAGFVKFEGMVDARSFKAGKLLGYDPLGEVSLHTELMVEKHERHFNGTIRGSIDSLYYNGNRFDSIYLDGMASNKSYNGQLRISDDKLQLDFSGIANLEGPTPIFDFSSVVRKADLYTLGLDKTHRDAGCSLEMKANFSGKNIDELSGSILVRNLKLTREGRKFEVGKADLNTTNTLTNNTITFRSDVADVDISGRYKFLEIGLTLRDYLNHYLPSADLPFSREGVAGENVFSFNVNVKKPEQIAGFYLPELMPASPVTIRGDINSGNKTFSFNCSAGNISYKDYHARGFSFTSGNSDRAWLLRLGMDQFSLGQNYSLDKVAVDGRFVSDSVQTSLSWGKPEDKKYCGRIDMDGHYSRNPEGMSMFDLVVRPSTITISDTLWRFDKSTLHFDSTSVKVDNFNLHHKDEFLQIQGQLSDNPSDILKISLSKLNLGFFDLVSKQKTGIDGLMSGETEIADVNNSFFLNSNLVIRNFHYEKDLFGDVMLDNIWNKEEKRLYSSIRLNKKDTTTLLIKGFYEPDAGSINYNAQLTSFPLETIYPFLRTFSNKLSGKGNGSVAITGTLSDPSFIGRVDIRDGLIGLDYTKVAYTFNHPVEFSGDSILFRKIPIYDKSNNLALLDGYITHKMFSKLRYHLGVNTKRLEALKTTLADNNLFYGEAHCSGDAMITGYADEVRLDLNLKSEEGTQITIPLETPVTAAENKFIRFVGNSTKTEKSEVPEEEESSGSLEVNLNIAATPEAKMQILFNSSLGDAITGQGSGNLRMSYDRHDNFTMFGTYNVDRGDYLFTLQNVIGKKFKLEEGGTITWNGDPYEAIVDINAVYNLKASVKNLLGDTYKTENAGRIPVTCKINLSHKLLNPVLKFDILFPAADERTRDEMQQFISTQDDVNRQMLTLLLIGQFYTPEYIRGRTDSQTNTGALVGATTSEMLSSQLSNWLSQISTNFDIGFKYRPGDQVNTNQMELALSTQIFDDRVTINGNIGNNSVLQTTNAAAANSVVGEIEMFIKLIRSGKLQLKLYNRANTDFTYDTAPYKQGVGFSYRESFNSWRELLNPGRYNRKTKSANTGNKVIR